MNRTFILVLFIVIFMALVIYISTSGMADTNMVLGMIGGAVIAVIFLVVRNRNKNSRNTS